MHSQEILSQVQRLYEEGDYETAFDLAEETACREPGNAAAFRALGVIGLRLERIGSERALGYYEEALRLAPADPEVHFSLAQYHLARGDYRRGFAAYEARIALPRSVATFYTQRAPFWDGRTLDGEVLLVHCEQGIGDAIQFVRFLPRVRERVRTVVLACHRELHALFAKLEGVSLVVTEDHPTPRFDFQIPLASLARLFEVTLESLPAFAPGPYLSLPSLPAKERSRLRVGLVWRAKVPSGTWKSLSLEQLKPLASLPVDWVSLQKEIDPGEAALLRDHFQALEAGSALRDFRETAALVQSLDLVVSVDTAVAHLAGALGRPVWILLPRWADWRWMIDRTDSPWYPTAVLFRQRREGDWSIPLCEIAKRLETVKPFGDPGVIP